MELGGMELPLSKVTLEIFSKLEQKWLYHNNYSSDMSRRTRILTIDGGGSTGIVSGAALIHLENQIQTRTNDPHARISDFFDILVGTGIGALYACLLSVSEISGRGGRPLYTAKEAVDFVTENHSQLFKPAGLFKKRFSGKSMEKVLKLGFKSKGGDGTKLLTLKDTCKPVLVPCFDLYSCAPFVFSRAGACDSPSFDFELWKVCRATMATPSLFKPFELSSVDGKTVCLGVDGGLVMNNPTAAAVTHVIHNKRDFPSVNGVEDLLVLSLGNGPLSNSCSSPSPNPNNKPSSFSSRRRGRMSCTTNSSVGGGTGKGGECSTAAVVDIVRDGVSETIDQMLGNAFSWNLTDYVRIQANSSGPTMEEVLNEKGVESLPFGGKRLLTETNGQRIENFVHRLVASSSRSSLPCSPCKPVSPLVDGR